MFTSYRAALRVPGAAAFCSAGFVMRLPIAMYPLGLVLLISTRSGEYTFAGLLSGAYILGGAIGFPVLGRLVDRLGQGSLIRPASAVHIGAMGTLIALDRTAAARWTLLPAAFVAGFAYLSVGSLTRARWSHVLAGRPELGAAYSIESVLDEVIFVIGPLVATVLATQVTPVLTLALGAALVGGGAMWLAGQPGTEPPPQGRSDVARQAALRARGMVLLTATTAFMGAVFATAEVSMVAFCGQRGHPGASGVVLAAFAFGSGTSGLIYGGRTFRSDITHRFRQQAVVFGLLTFAFLAATNVPLLAVCAAVVGLGIAPTLITGFSLVEELVAPGGLTEGLAWMSTGLNIGYGIGASLAGRVADESGARAGFTLTIGAGLGIAALAVALHRRMAAGPRDAAGQFHHRC